jgi:hypothetical protein
MGEAIGRGAGLSMYANVRKTIHCVIAVVDWSTVALWFGKGRALNKARKAELLGDYGAAIAFYADAGAPNECARVLCLRGDGELDRRARLMHYTQAAKMATQDSQVWREAKQKRAELIVSEFESQVTSAAHRNDLREAARELESVGAFDAAAKAFFLAGDRESHARALSEAGEVDALENVLEVDAQGERLARALAAALQKAADDMDIGSRRDALTSLQLYAKTYPENDDIQNRIAQLERGRIDARGFELESRGVRTRMTLHSEVTIGRTEATLNVASIAVSRAHLRIFRRDGAIYVEDLGSRNGTFLRGVRLAGAIPIHEPCELLIGNEVPLRLAPREQPSSGIAIGVAGQDVFATLGAANLGGWRVVSGADNWVELHGDAYRGDLKMAPVIALLRHDAFSEARAGETIFRVH